MTLRRQRRRRPGIMSSRSLPRLGGVCLRRRRRGCGGKVRSWILFRSVRLARSLRLGAWRLPAPTFVDAVVVAGLQEDWWFDRIRLHRDGGCYRRLHHRRFNLDSDPDGWAFNDFFAFARSSVFCSPPQRRRFPPAFGASGLVAAAGGGGLRRRRLRLVSVLDGSKDRFVIFLFAEVLIDYRRGSYHMYLFMVYLYCFSFN